MNLFQATRSEQVVFADLDALCGQPGYVHVLAYFSLRDNLVSYDGQMTQEALAASYVPSRTIRTEFATLMGLMLKHPLHFDLPTSQNFQSLVDTTQGLLKELHACLNQPLINALKQAASAHEAGLTMDQTVSPFGRGDVLREPIFYGGESAYSFQYRDFVLDRYADDDEWLQSKKGFRIADARAVSGALMQLQRRKMLATIDGMLRLDVSQWTALPGLITSLDEIAQESCLVPETVSAVLAAFTAPDSPTNLDFNSLGEFNIANAFPILRSPSGEYIALETYSLLEALYDSPFYWMAADKSYKDVAFTHRGAFTERFVAKRLAVVFGASNVYRGVNILCNGTGVGEIDVLVLFADRALVIQCKSKKLTLEARKGNDLQLKDDFKKAVQGAYDQAYLCCMSLSDRNLEFVDQDGRKIGLRELREIYPLCVVSDHYPALTVQAREFLKYKRDQIIQPPLVGDVFLVDVLAEMLPSPLRLLSYVNRRVNYEQRIAPVNELAILGYHLRNNLWIEDKMNMVMIAEEFALELDTAMTVRREGIDGDRTPRGILTSLDGTLVGRILGVIEHSTESSLIDLGFMLLTLSGETLDDLNRGLREVAQRARSDGEVHDFTLAFDWGDTGLTVHCGSLANADALRKLTEHCERRKYVHRAESWFGLVVRRDDGLPKFGIELRFPWKQDDKMDETTKGMARAGGTRPGGSMSKRHKVGRNELCPCGSGKKFKKCCLN
jgi:hypothetical protein